MALSVRLLTRYYKKVLLTEDLIEKWIFSVPSSLFNGRNLVRAFLPLRFLAATDCFCP